MRKKYYILPILLWSISGFIFSMQIDRNTDNLSEVSELSEDETVPYNKQGLKEKLLATENELKNTKKELLRATQQTHSTRHFLSQSDGELRYACRRLAKTEKCLDIHKWVGVAGIYCCGALVYLASSSPLCKKSDM